MGVEFASIFRSFGTEVTIVEFLPRMVPVEDEEISKELTRLFKKRGIDVNTGCKVEKIEKTETGVKVTWTDRQRQSRKRRKPRRFSSPSAARRAPQTSASRRPRSSSIAASSRSTRRSRPPSPASTPSATSWPACRSLPTSGAMSGIVAVAKIAGRPFRPVRRDRIPGCTYSDPQIGSAGLTEAQAKEKGYEVKVGKFPFAGNSKATIVDSHDGFVKIVSDAKYGEILGVHIIGPQATELIAEAVAVMELEGTVDELMFTIHAHPTLSEAMLDAYARSRGHGHQRIRICVGEHARVRTGWQSNPAG